jgi:hypothetical protein
MSINFPQPFLEELTDDEHSLLCSILNQGKSTVYELAYCRAGVVINNLNHAQLTEEGEVARKSILEKYNHAMGNSTK